VPGAREAVSGPIDVDAALARRDEMTGGGDDASQVRWLTDKGITLIRGTARVCGVRSVDVSPPDGGDAVRLEARLAVVVATGTSAAVPPIPGLHDIRIWDNRDATAAQHIPARLLVLGGGAVGVEMAQAFRRLGSEQVTIVERHRASCRTRSRSPATSSVPRSKPRASR
jgi:pyruvate/2-oxoglutarate dehydrogenase complex dihydrolipoamide dehydrogenase (E3) component